MNGKVEVIHLNLLSGAGREMGAKYKVMVTPATLLFNQQGELIDRKLGMPDTAQWQKKLE
jgi:thioredoxin-related protein